MTTKTLNQLCRKCGYFTTNCKNHCNNNYGCKHPENKPEPGNCEIHGRCNPDECPIAEMIDESNGGGDAIMQEHKMGQISEVKK